MESTYRNGTSTHPPSSTSNPTQQPLLMDLIHELRSKLVIERSIADGAQSLLSVFDHDNDSSSNPHLRSQVRDELNAANDKVAQLQATLDHLEATASTPPPHKSLASESTLLRQLPTGAPSTNGHYQPIQPPLTPADPPSPSNLTSAEHAESFAVTFDGVVSLLLKLDSLGTPGERIKTMDSIVASLLKEQRIKFELQLEEVLHSILDGLSDTQTTDVRASTYRLLRHLVVDQHDVSLLGSHHISLFLIRSLCRSDKSELEKEHALRFIRLLLSLPDAPHAVPSSVIRAIVALAESQDEKLRLACLETLGELLIRDTQLLVASDGLRVVLQALSDGPHDFSPFLAMGFLWVVDKPGTRHYLRPGVDIEIVLAGLTEIHAKGSSHEEKVKASAKIVASFLKSWSGLMYLCLNGKQALVSLVNSLKTPSQVIRDALLDTFFNIFRIAQVASNPSPSIGLNGFHTKKAKSSKSSPGINQRHNSTPGPNLIDQYLAILLLVFLDAGFIEALIAVASESLDALTSKKVSILISEVLQMSTRVLPLSYVTRVQALPKLFSLAASFDTSDARLAATATLNTIDAFNRDKGKLQPGPIVDGLRNRANSLDDPLKRGQRQVDSAKIRMGMQIDDAHFRNLLLETQVLSTKDHTRWSLDILIGLLEGPLLNPRRLDEAMRASKFMRRLLSFFHPFGYRYGEISKTAKDAERYTHLGCLTITTLLANPDGVRYLGEDKLLPQIADCLAQLDPLGGPTPSDLLLSKYRMEKTLASGYFEMLGTLTKTKDGVKLLEQFKVFTAFYRISELRSRDDIIKAIVCNLDYSRDGHTRVFLSKALTSSYKHVRIFATEHLAKLTRESLVSEEWQIRLLLTQLYDPAQEVCELAVHVLEEACQSLETLEILVEMRPSLDHLGDMGVELMIRFLSTSVGVRYLHETDFIDRELEDWFLERNFTYMVQTELLLASAFEFGPSDNTADRTLFDGKPPPHFYGELVKTPEGCEILADSGHFARFADFIQQHGLEDYDTEVIARLKSVLWAVGHIGASSGGLPFLEQEFIVQSIIEIAEDSPVYSLRGTAYFVLGLISSTSEGVDILEEMGWESVCTPLGGSTGVCVPYNVCDFVETPAWEPAETEIPASALLASPTSHLEREALAAFANLSNHILATKASKSLARLKTRHRDVFSSMPLFYRALEMLSNYHYRLAVRRYMIELFDISLSDKVAQEIMVAGEKLRTKSLDVGSDSRIAWALPTTTQSMLVEGVDGDFTDDESSQEEGATIPVQVLQPLLTIRGFLIS